MAGITLDEAPSSEPHNNLACRTPLHGSHNKNLTRHPEFPMIALFAAVPFETDLLRSHLTQETTGGWSGRISNCEVVLAHTGVGKANAAAISTELILGKRPTAVILLGCGGAFPGSGLGLGDLALASSEIFGDEGCMTADGFLDLAAMQLPLSCGAEVLYNQIPLPTRLVNACTPQLQSFAASNERRLQIGPFVTVSTCSGTARRGTQLEKRTGGICENMEGAAVALVCHRHRLPLLELRGISNLVEDRNLQNWNLAAASNICQHAVLQLLSDWPEENCR